METVLVLLTMAATSRLTVISMRDTIEEELTGVGEVVNVLGDGLVPFGVGVKDIVDVK